MCIWPMKISKYKCHVPFIKIHFKETKKISLGYHLFILRMTQCYDSNNKKKFTIKVKMKYEFFLLRWRTQYTAVFIILMKKTKNKIKIKEYERKWCAEDSGNLYSTFFLFCLVLVWFLKFILKTSTSCHSKSPIRLKFLFEHIFLNHIKSQWAKINYNWLKTNPIFSMVELVICRKNFQIIWISFTLSTRNSVYKSRFYFSWHSCIANTWNSSGFFVVKLFFSLIPCAF